MLRVRNDSCCLLVLGCGDNLVQQQREHDESRRQWVEQGC
jgi:hypothetical protein